ncbi:MAG: 50S ribosomal protein L9 [Candidatus Omnitrophica bacterium]|nr:50S ribosomal protein L9 [Candidatus Omnitrophota bacterium]
MDVILVRDVEKVGKAGTVVKVRDGYARNFLFPRNLGILSTSKNLLRLEMKKKGQIRKQTEAKEQSIALAQKIEKLSCTIKMQAGENDRLYGSVTSQNIQEALSQLGVHIDKKDIFIEEPIRKLGQAAVMVKLHPEVEARLKVWIVKQ